MKMVVLLLMLIFLIGLSSASLGITPAKQEVDFIPGEKYEFKFTIISDDPLKEIDLYLAGDLAEYGKLDKEKIVGTESFKVTLIIPDDIDLPGRHSLIARGIEVVPEDNFLGTKIDIGAPISVFIPYPGRYLELALNVPNANVDEVVLAELNVINRGVDDLFVSAYIDFSDTSGEVIQRMDFDGVQVNPTKSKSFKGNLDISKFKAGDYVAEGFADYGEIKNVSSLFRIGYLYVNITNFTDRIVGGGIKKYHVEIESFWNDYLNEVFADVNVSNETISVSFRTPSIDLRPWNKGFLEGYIDSTGLNGEYISNITLVYEGQKTFALGKLFVRASENATIIILAIVGATVLLIAIIIVLIIIKRKIKKRR